MLRRLGINRLLLCRGGEKWDAGVPLFEFSFLEPKLGNLKMSVRSRPAVVSSWASDVSVSSSLGTKYQRIDLETESKAIQLPVLAFQVDWARPFQSSTGKGFA